jgi:hypothetical protein
MEAGRKLAPRVDRSGDFAAPRTGVVLPPLLCLNSSGRKVGVLVLDLAALQQKGAWERPFL